MGGSHLRITLLNRRSGLLQSPASVSEDSLEAPKSWERSRSIVGPGTVESGPSEPGNSGLPPLFPEILGISTPGGSGIPLYFPGYLDRERGVPKEDCGFSVNSLARNVRPGEPLLFLSPAARSPVGQ